MRYSQSKLLNELRYYKRRFWPSEHRVSVLHQFMKLKCNHKTKIRKSTLSAFYTVVIQRTSLRNGEPPLSSLNEKKVLFIRQLIKKAAHFTSKVKIKKLHPRQMGKNRHKKQINNLI